MKNIVSEYTILKFVHILKLCRTNTGVDLPEGEARRLEIMAEKFEKRIEEQELWMRKVKKEVSSAQYKCSAALLFGKILEESSECLSQESKSCLFFSLFCLLCIIAFIIS